MPMRGELASPALRRRHDGGADEMSFRAVGDALNALDPRIVIVSAAGLLANLVFVLLAPSSALEITAALALTF